jgi:hypothetical protein
MFNTGDLACWQEDGCVQMLGRGDAQVKIKVRSFITTKDVINLRRASVSNSMVLPRLLRYVTIMLDGYKYTDISRRSRV